MLCVSKLYKTEFVIYDELNRRYDWTARTLMLLHVSSLEADIFFPQNDFMIGLGNITAANKKSLKGGPEKGRLVSLWEIQRIYRLLLSPCQAWEPGVELCLATVIKGLSVGVGLDKDVADGIPQVPCHQELALGPLPACVDIQEEMLLIPNNLENKHLKDRVFIIRIVTLMLILILILEAKMTLKSEQISSFEVLDVPFWGTKTSPITWTSCM